MSASSYGIMDHHQRAFIKNLMGADVETHSQTVDRIQVILLKERRGMVETRGMQDTRKCLTELTSQRS